jgi:hypothetical protein
VTASTNKAHHLSNGKGSSGFKVELKRQMHQNDTKDAKDKPMRSSILLSDLAHFSRNSDRKQAK